MDKAGNTRRRRRQAAEMFPLIEAWQASGQTQKDYCANAGLSQAVFTYWLTRYREQHEVGDHTADFISLKVDQAAEEWSGGIEIIYPSGAIVRFRQGVSAEYLRQLLDQP